MNQDDSCKDDDDQHIHDIVMPGYRFHPTEEELIDFYLRRKVEGKRFSVELITFLDLYRYDPWELPALATIGEKEWFFYVPRDRKYRNGDRPNRVTTSGYWKATGADRMIRSESFRSIGLKKTLVFYSGKAPKGIRTSWIMNEYRLPHHETEILQKTEISLCRVYKRAGVEDHPSVLPRSLPTSAPSSRGALLDKKQREATSHAAMERFQALEGGGGGGGHAQAQVDETEKMSETSGSSSTDAGGGGGGGGGGSALGFSHHDSYTAALASMASRPLASPSPAEDDGGVVLLQQSRQGFSFAPLVPLQNPVDDLHRLISFQQASSIIQQQQYHLNHLYHPSSSSSSSPASQPHAPSHSLLPPPLNSLPGSLQAAFSDRFLEWNSVMEGNKEYTNNPFK
ncbi:hypothetical protein U1Q18_035571 [Sarracenia purpurea var. burkii]